MVGMASGQLVELWSGKVRSHQGQVTRRAPTHKLKDTAAMLGYVIFGMDTLLPKSKKGFLPVCAPRDTSAKPLAELSAELKLERTLPTST